MSGPSETCPICGKPRHDQYRPFCSKRCADLDLGQWLRGGYTIAGPAEEDEAGPPPPSNDDDPPKGA